MPLKMKQFQWLNYITSIDFYISFRHLSLGNRRQHCICHYRCQSILAHNSHKASTLVASKIPVCSVVFAKAVWMKSCMTINSDKSFYLWTYKTNTFRKWSLKSLFSFRDTFSHGSLQAVTSCQHLLDTRSPKKAQKKLQISIAFIQWHLELQFYYSATFWKNWYR